MKKTVQIFAVAAILLSTTACGGTSSACKKVYDREIEYYIKDAEMMKTFVDNNGEKMAIGGTSFFMPSDAEEKTLESCEYDEEMSANMEKAKQVSKDFRDLEKTKNSLTLETNKDRKAAIIEQFKKQIDKMLEKYSKDEALEIKKFGN